MNEEFDKMGKKANSEKKFLGNILIHKGDTKKEIVRKIIFLVSLIVFIAMIADIAFYYINPMLQQQKFENAAKEYHSAENSRGYYSSEINPKFKSLYKKNKDLIGWITIDGTNIDYPVMQSKEEQFYLRRGFDKSYSREGSIFADKDCSIKYKNESKNIMLYGHHMVSTGTMFKQLDKYLDISFYKKHPNIIFDSLYRDSEYKIFAVFITNAIPSQDNGNFYDYSKADFSSASDFAYWINQARVRSIINTDVTVTEDDEILTLQTCNDTFESDDEKARLIIMARRVRDGEDSKTDTSNAVENENPRYPQIWYDQKGLSNPYKNADEGVQRVIASTTASTKAVKKPTASTTVKKTETKTETTKKTTETKAKKTTAKTTKSKTVKQTAKATALLQTTVKSTEKATATTTSITTSQTTEKATEKTAETTKK